MNPYTLLAVVVAVGAAVGGAYPQGRKDGAATVEAAAAREERIGKIAGAAAAASAAEAISKQEIRHVTVTQKLQREVIEKPVFRDCRSGPDALSLFNSAIPGAAPAGSAPDRGQLPAPNPAAR